jgi:hypothetical protein
MGRRDRQLDFCAGIRLTPYVELAGNEIGALAHAAQAIVPFSVALG